MTDESPWPDDMTGSERVEIVARALGQPQTANWIAREAAVAHETARTYLDRLAERNVLERETRGSLTTYAPNELSRYLEEVHELYRAHTPEELAESLAEMNAAVRAWREAFDVASPNELRATIAADSIGPDESRRRRDVAAEWEHVRSRIDVVETTLQLYDRFDGRSGRAPA